MPNTPYSTLPYPALSDAANAPAAFSSLAGALDGKTVMTFTTQAARTAAIAAPVAGMVTYCADVGYHEAYYNGAWRSLTQMRPIGFGPTMVGTAPTLPAALLIQTGSSVITTNSSGDVGIVFPVTFPNALLTLTVSNGDGATRASCVCAVTSMGLANCNVRYWLSSTGAVSATLATRTNWIAIGW